MRVAIIGAGAAGLASAALLAREGHEVHVLERGSRIGGRAGRIEQDGYLWDTGPSWYLMPEVYDHFFRLLGTSAREELDLRLLDPGYRVLSGSGPGDLSAVDVPHGREAVARLFEDVEPGAGAAIGDYLDSARQALEISLDYFLYNPFSTPASLRGALGTSVDLTRWLATSLWMFAGQRFSSPVLRQILTYPGIFLGADPRQAPAIYHLMSQIDLDEGVLYPRGGFTGVMTALERLAREAGARITLNAEVTEIGVSPARGLWGAGGLSGRKGVARGVAWRDARNEGAPVQRERAEAVITAADLHHTETVLVPERYRTYPERTWRRTAPGPSAVLVMLGVRGEVPELGHHTLMFTTDWEASLDAVFTAGVASHTDPLPDPTSLYVCKPSATDDGVAPEGRSNLFVLVPVSGELGLGGAEDPQVQAIADRAVQQIVDWAGTELEVEARHVIGPADFGRDYHSWKDGMLGPAHVLRQSAMFRRGPASRTVDGLYYAGATASPGVGVPMCLISAELMVKMIRGDSSPGPLPEPV